MDFRSCISLSPDKEHSRRDESILGKEETQPADHSALTQE
jgi:hypothetical protein